MTSLVYFSSTSENTHRFVQRLGIPAQRIPVRPADAPLEVDEPYVLIVPTYGGGNEGGAVPRQVVKFLNNVTNRSLIRGVIAAGNTNFGTAYCLAGPIIAAKCAVPYLYGFEILGTPEDVIRVRDGLDLWWQQQRLLPA
ncbi:class Ib ribonucleoside-diphosphate reductase assembly flavoprotein NrdI [Pengzhenrongella phosphoraccumulans]|uniref:class Ib ribonucleoside-diphosphate reductase assembly flavoprotein NrdI n=1 Tax=Pengzhenrongella phosphoraccumulans TaxID=3114394 RepID=UPI00388FC1C3